jgi:hypothetical protein
LKITKHARAHNLEFPTPEGIKTFARLREKPENTYLKIRYKTTQGPCGVQYFQPFLKGLNM